METNSALDRIISDCTSVTERVYDGRTLMYTNELTPAEYVALFAGHLYNRHVVGQKTRLRTVVNHYLGVRYIATVSHGNGCKTTYELHY